MIEMNGICKTYGSRDTKTSVLKDFNIRIADGEFVILFGRSGCGKTTLLNIIGLLDQADSGDYYLDGQSVVDMTEKERANTRNATLGYIFQGFYLLPDLNVAENISLPLKYAGLSKKKRDEKALLLLDEIGLLRKRDLKPVELSGGEKQRVAIARALSNQPKYILADEPTGSLDIANRDQIMRVLMKMHKEKGCSIIMVTHDRELLPYADTIVKMQ